MGSWDFTCAISHLPILWEEPVRYFFIREPKYDNDSRDTGWEPIGLPLKGIYDGNSGVTEVEQTGQVKLLVEVMARFASPMPEDERKMMGGFPDLEGYPNSLDSLVHGAERGWLKLNVPFFTTDEEDRKDPKDRKDRKDRELEYKEVRVRPYMVREEVYQAMCLPGSEQLAIGTGREKIEKHQNEHIKHLRGGFETATRIRADKPKGLGISEEADGLLRETYKSLEEFLEISLDPSMDRAWGLLFCDARVNAQEYSTPFEFTDADWEQLDADFMDWMTFQWTLHELNRVLHPHIYTNQYNFYYDDVLGANEMLALRLLKEWSPAIYEANKREDDE